jgi:2-dehydropantoate 2-reductase
MYERNLTTSEREKMKIMILGAGGVGGYFGSRLIEAGADITYRLREKRQQSLDEKGLEIESPHGNLNLKVKTTTARTVNPGFDLVLLAPKGLRPRFPIGVAVQCRR